MTEKVSSEKAVLPEEKRENEEHVVLSIPLKALRVPTVNGSTVVWITWQQIGLDQPLVLLLILSAEGKHET